MDAATLAELNELHAQLTPSTRVAVLTGAGISAASGIPTFRGAQDGLWSRYRPEDLATPEAFARDPELVWRWYDWRRGLIAASGPNAAHRALATLGERTSLTLVTQNVDGYHQQAGSAAVVEFHGSIWRVRCTDCGHETEDHRVPLPIPPACRRCGALTRPAVVWFGEGIDPGVMETAVHASATCAVFLVIGTAGVVHPAAGLAELAHSRGARVVEFNPEPTPVTRLAHLHVPGSAADSLPRLVE
jgi:NAD-dependent deacetylase